MFVITIDKVKTERIFYNHKPRIFFTKCRYRLCTVADCPKILIAAAGSFPFYPCTCSWCRWWWKGRTLGRVWYFCCSSWALITDDDDDFGDAAINEVFDTTDVEAALDLDDNWRVATVGAVETTNRTVDTSNLSYWHRAILMLASKYCFCSIKTYRCKPEIGS